MGMHEQHPQRAATSLLCELFIVEALDALQRCFVKTVKESRSKVDFCGIPSWADSAAGHPLYRDSAPRSRGMAEKDICSLLRMLWWWLCSGTQVSWQEIPCCRAGFLVACPSQCC